jgi:hypothetical protein
MFPGIRTATADRLPSTPASAMYGFSPMEDIDPGLMPRVQLLREALSVRRGFREGDPWQAGSLSGGRVGLLAARREHYLLAWEERGAFRRDYGRFEGRLKIVNPPAPLPASTTSDFLSG